MSDRGRTRALPWALFALVIAMQSVALILAPSPQPVEDLSFMVPMMAMALVGSLILSGLPGNRMGRIFFAIGAAPAVGSLGGAYAELALVRHPGLPGGIPAALVSGFWFPVMLLLLTLLLLLFPTGKVFSKGGRWIAGAAVFAFLFGFVHLFDPGPLDAALETQLPVQNPLGVAAFEPYFDVISNLWFFLTISTLLASAVAMIVRFRRSVGEERQQLKWFAYGTAAFGVDLMVEAILFDFVLTIETGVAGEVIGATTLLLIPLTAAVAILRYRLFDIDLVINRTLVYGGLTATLGAGYFGGVVLLQELFRPLTAGSDLAIAGSTLAVAALFRPLRHRVQAFVDRRFYRRKYDAARALEDFSNRLTREIDLDSLNSELRAVLGNTMQPAGVTVWVRRESTGLSR